jgi:hypothetical protein
MTPCPICNGIVRPETLCTCLECGRVGCATCVPLVDDTEPEKGRLCGPCLKAYETGFEPLSEHERVPWGESPYADDYEEES